MLPTCHSLPLDQPLDISVFNLKDCRHRDLGMSMPSANVESQDGYWINPGGA